MLLTILAYFLVCVFVAWAGRAREIGFAGFLVLSIVLSPLVTALILLISSSRKGEA